MKTEYTDKSETSFILRPESNSEMKFLAKLRDLLERSDKKVIMVGCQDLEHKIPSTDITGIKGLHLRVEGGTK